MEIEMGKLSTLSSAARLIVLSVAVLGLLGSSAVYAQDVAVGSATATVQAVLSVTATSALAFSTVYQGIPKSIANNNASAGVFTITGQGGAGVAVYMQLPDYLSTATGDDRMVIAFSTSDASMDSTSNTDPTSFGSGWQNTDPHNFPAATTVGTVGQNQSAIFLGGKVIPTVDQAAGAYTGDIVLTVAYNGS
ncbi:MAG: hypothetical protein JSU65_12735 [Candidatus Zixiibacteriota bacterium]|nr:MAG: hypothetical protein JSU65_12735 [candidate division Zixibacteria bacterium]